MEARTIGGYRLLEHIADGGSARCWRAEDAQGRVYILKQFRPRSLAPYLQETPAGAIVPAEDSPALRRRFDAALRLFRREAEAAREIRALHAEGSSNDYFYACTLTEADDGAFLLYDTTGGETLADLLARRQLHLDADRGGLTAIAWTRRIAEATAQMHGHLDRAGQSAPWLHLDLKPANIYCTRMELDGDEGKRVFRLLDLGSAYPLGLSLEDAAIRAETALSSTPDYAAPELLLPDTRPTAAADVYSIGAILFRMLSGHAYDCHDLPPETPAVRALPRAARHVLAEELLRPILESPPEARPGLHTVVEKLDLLRQIILHRGVCREVLFTGACRFMETLPEQPEPALLPRWQLEKSAFDTLAHLLKTTEGHLFLAGSGMRGKTFSLLHAAAELTVTPVDPIPLYVPLGAFRGAVDKDHFLRDWLLSRYGGEQGPEDPADALETCLNTGCFLLLADGLNEAAGDPAFPRLTAELRRLLGLRGLRVVISAQTDMRSTVFPGCAMELAEPLPLPDGRVEAYLSAAGLSPGADPVLREALRSPMLLKMYARSAAAVTDPVLLADRRFRFRPNPRTAAEIVVNYREHVLAKLYDPRRPEDFPLTALLVREFLPQLAFRLCAGDNWFALPQVLLQTELNHFFRELQSPRGLSLLAAYDYPDLTFGQPDTAELDSSFAFGRAVEVRLSEEQTDRDFSSTLRLLQDLGVAEDSREARELMGEQFFAASASGVTRHIIASGRRAAACGRILSASGLLRQNERGAWRFLHDSLRDIFCADHLHRFLERCGDPAQRKLTMGRHHLSRPICRHLGDLCGPGFLRRCISGQRGRFDPCSVWTLSDYRNEALSFSIQDYQVDDLGLLSVLCGLQLMLPDDHPLSPEELEAILAGEADLPEEQNPYAAVEGVMLSAAANSLLCRRLTLTDPDKTVPLTFLQCAPELLAMSCGSHALATANLVDTLLLSVGTLAGEDLSRLDLSATRLRQVPLTGARLNHSFLFAEDLRGFDFSDYRPGESCFLQHNHSGRFLYLSYGSRLRAFDLWEEQEIRDFALDWEPDAPILRLHLSPDRPILTAVLKDSAVWLLDACSGDPLAAAYPLEDAPAGKRALYAVCQGQQLYIQMAEDGIIVEYALEEEAPPQLVQVMERRRLNPRDTLLRGRLTRPGFTLQRLAGSLRYREKAEQGGTPRSLGRMAGSHFAAAYSPDGQQITLFGSGGIEVIDTATGLTLNRLPARHQHVTWRLHTDDTLRAHLEDGRVRDRRTGKVLPGVSAVPPQAFSAGNGFFLRQGSQVLLRNGSLAAELPPDIVCAWLQGTVCFAVSARPTENQLTLWQLEGGTGHALHRFDIPPRETDPRTLPQLLERMHRTFYSLCVLNGRYYLARSTPDTLELLAVPETDTPILRMKTDDLGPVELFPAGDHLLLSGKNFIISVDPLGKAAPAYYGGISLRDRIGSTFLVRCGEIPEDFAARHPDCRILRMPDSTLCEFPEMEGADIRGLLPPLTREEAAHLQRHGALTGREEVP